MAFLDNCIGTVELPESFEVECDILLQDCGISSLYFYVCDHELPDLTQGSIDAAIAAKKLQKVPLANVNLTVEDGAVIEAGCRKLYRPSTFTLEIKSPSMSVGSEADVWWKNIFKVRQKLTVAWKECNEKFVINQKITEWIVGGYVGSMPNEPFGIQIESMSMPSKVRDNELCQYQFKITFKNSDVLCSTLIPGIEL